MIVRNQLLEFVKKSDPPKYLTEKGYIFEIKKLKVRVGNILTCLEHLLLLSKNTESLARIGKFNSDGILVLKNYTEFDFRSDKNKNCNKLIITDGNYINNHPFDDRLYNDNLSCLKYLKELILKVEPDEWIDDYTLVIHVRSGDIFRKKYPHVHPEFYQPPLSYYDHIINSRKFTDILIVTEHNNMNPIVEKLLSSYSHARLSEGNFLEDINIMLNASNFVCARSALSFIISRMNSNLKSVYLWVDKNKLWREWFPTKNNCLSHNFLTITEYSADNYIEVGEWKNTKEQIELMMNFPKEKLKING